MGETGAGSFRSRPESRLLAAPATALRRRLLDTPVAALCLLGTLGFYLKVESMGPQWSLAARLYGAGKEFGGLERLGFYCDDLLLNFILIPLAGALLAQFLSRRLRTVVFAGFTVAATLLYFVQLRAHAEIGQYISVQLMVESFSWGVHNPGAIGDYLSLGSVLKLGAFLSLLFFLFAGESLLASRRSAVGACWRACHRCLIVTLAGGLPVAALLLLPFGYAHYAADSHLHRSAVENVITALIRTQAGDRLQFDLSLKELLAQSRPPSATAPPAGDPRIGMEKGADILLFVLETTPAQVFDVTASGSKLPGLGRLYPRSFLGAEHFSTYPYTSDALFSVLSGLYPQGRRQFLGEATVAQFAGLMSALDPQEYVRAVYAPDLYGAEMDDRMYRVFGADRTYYAAADADGAARVQAKARAQRLLAEWERTQPPFATPLRQELSDRLTLDLQALAQLKEEIVAVKKSGRRFCSLFLPQIAHGPWLNLHSRADIAARGHDLALLQDQWLAEILDLLAAHGWLDNTIIVFTADHGIRTRNEDPGLALGKLSRYMLQVPLLIHAPRTLRQPVILPAPTSHIDIAPTVLALLGDTATSAAMQGVPVWRRAKSDRIFLLAADYAGADGFIDNGTFYMHHLLSDAVFVSDRLEFADSDLLAAQAEKSEFVRRSLRQANALQISIVRRLLRDGHSVSRTVGVQPPLRQAAGGG